LLSALLQYKLMEGGAESGHTATNGINDSGHG
jgi:hypothetical protein